MREFKKDGEEGTSRGKRRGERGRNGKRCQKKNTRLGAVGSSARGERGWRQEKGTEKRPSIRIELPNGLSKPTILKKNRVNNKERHRRVKEKWGPQGSSLGKKKKTERD